MLAIKMIAAFFAVIFVMIVAGMAIDGSALLWMPFRVQQETKIIRASNGYVTAQQEQLRDLRSSYDSATPEQKAGILRQMRELADRIPGNVQPDIATFLNN